MTVIAGAEQGGARGNTCFFSGGQGAARSVLPSNTVQHDAVLSERC